MRRRCVRAYYGTGRHWGMVDEEQAGEDANGMKKKKKKNMTLYCQAEGCGKEIKRWYWVETILLPHIHRVAGHAKKDPAWEKTFEREREKQREAERKAEKAARKQSSSGGELDEFTSGWRGAYLVLCVVCCWCCLFKDVFSY